MQLRAEDWNFDLSLSTILAILAAQRKIAGLRTFN